MKELDIEEVTIIAKTIKTIDSCETQEQLQTTLKWIRGISDIKDKYKARLARRIDTRSLAIEINDDAQLKEYEQM